MIPYPLPELIDRLSICKLKVERIGEKTCMDEYEYLRKAVEEDDFVNYTYEEYVDWLNRLYDINKIIWDWEAAVRQGLDNHLGLEEIGRRALKIRENNKIRIAIKNEIAKKSNSGFPDIKMNHASI